MVALNRIAEFGALIGDPGRAAMLLSLLDGRALTARELADQAGVTPQTASRHLAKLLAAGLLRMEPQGRHRYHRLASVEVAHLLETMHIAADARAPATRRSGPSDTRLREVRTCYDHLAGRLAVQIAEAVTACDADGQIRLVPAGEATLVEWGLDLAALRSVRRVFCRYCLDWSERRPHLAGAVGAAILDHSLESGWLRRRDGARSLEVTATGRRGFRERFGISSCSDAQPSRPTGEAF